MAAIRDRVIDLRIFQPELDAGFHGGVWSLNGNEARHLLSVYRARPGDRFVVFNGKGSEWPAELKTIQGREASLELGAPTQHQALSPEVILIQAYPKNKNWDAELRQATELGVAEIRVAATRYSQADLGQLRNTGKVEKWQQTLVEACKQSGNPFLPRLPEPDTLEGTLRDCGPTDLCLIGSLEPDRLPIHDILVNWQTRRSGKLPDRIFAAVGPEGDFSPEEYALLKERSFVPVVLAPWVLRVDTAAVAFLGALQANLYSLRPPAN